MEQQARREQHRRGHREQHGHDSEPAHHRAHEQHAPHPRMRAAGGSSRPREGVYLRRRLAEEDDAAAAAVGAAAAPRQLVSSAASSSMLTWRTRGGRAAAGRVGGRALRAVGHADARVLGPGGARGGGAARRRGGAAAGGAARRRGAPAVRGRAAPAVVSGSVQLRGDGVRARVRDHRRAPRLLLGGAAPLLRLARPPPPPRRARRRPAAVGAARLPFRGYAVTRHREYSLNRYPQAALPAAESVAARPRAPPPLLCRSHAPATSSTRAPRAAARVRDVSTGATPRSTVRDAGEAGRAAARSSAARGRRAAVAVAAGAAGGAARYVSLTVKFSLGVAGLLSFRLAASSAARTRQQ